MKRWLLFPIIAAPVFAGALDEAARAIEEKVPQVAVTKLTTALAQTTGAQRSAVALKLASALLAAGRPQDAMDALLEVRAASGEEEAEKELLLAKGNLALGHWDDAAKSFRTAAAQGSSLAIQARLGEAEALHAQGRLPDAIKALQAMSAESSVAKLRLAEFYLEARDLKKARAAMGAAEPHGLTDAAWKKYLEGRSLLTQEQFAPALIVFEQLLHAPQGLTENLFAGATIGAAEARVELQGREAGDNIIEDFIWKNPASPFLEEMFARLDEIYASEENPNASELQKWSQRPPRRRGELASFYYAKSQVRAEKPDRALRVLATYAQQFPRSPLLPRALALQGETLLAQGKIADAIGAYEAAMRAGADPDFRGRMEIRAGVAHFQQKEFLLAANLFRAAATRSREVWAEATFNSALAWLHLGNYERFLEDYKALSARAPEGSLRRDLLLEEGLLQARSHDDRAVRTLELFARDFADRPGAAEARVALAEIAFLSADHAGAAEFLKAALETPHADDTAGRADYLAIFVADAAVPRDDAKVIQLCDQFLRRHPASELRAEARMKLGQVYFRSEDFANAQTQFETLAADASGTPIAETALFLAGQSARRSMNPDGIDHALELFDQVAQLNGPLKLYARQEQAIAKVWLRKNTEAALLYDVILQAKPERALRFAALCGKADTILNAADAATPIALYDQLARDPEVTPFWRNQALYKKARCLEKTDKAAALTAFYDVLQTSAPGEPEFFWFYKAGFDAGRLLEAQEKWEAAIGIYEKLVQAQGPRAEEAKKRAEQLRLEHFIWE